jgi:hypothetical protein
VKGTLKYAISSWGWLAAIAMAELTWLAMRVEMPAAGFLSYFKGFPWADNGVRPNAVNL